MEAPEKAAIETVWRSLKHLTGENIAGRLHSWFAAKAVVSISGDS